MSNQEQAIPAEQTLPNDWRDKVKYLWMMLRMGHEASMMDKHQKQNAIARAVARGAVKGDFSEVAGMDDDDMGVSIGNETHNHIQKQAGGVVPLLATLVGGTGLGAAAATWWALGGQPDDGTATPAPPAAATPPDTNTEYEFRLGFPDS